MFHVQVQPRNQQFAVLKGREKTKALCRVAVVAVLIATLWPFNPSPRNGIAWLRETSGLRFDRPGLIISYAPLSLAETEAGSCSLELLLRPASARDVSTILAFYQPTRTKQFMVRQWTDGLLVTHDATVASDKTKTIKFDVAHVFRQGRLVLVTISSGPAGTNVYLDGRPTQSFPGFKISPSEIAGEIVVGTSPTTYHPWLGELHGLAIYSKSLRPADAFRHYQQWTDPKGGPPDLEGAVARYAFTDRLGREVRNEVAYEPALEIPLTFSVPYKGFLQSVPKEFKADSRYVIDVLMNIAGFLPLGVIVCAHFTWTRSRWQAILIATVACGLLSFVIEVLQYYIPRRGSGITDILANTLGAALGAMLTQTGPLNRVLLRLGLIGTIQQLTEE